MSCRTALARTALALAACLPVAACSEDPEPTATSGTSRPPAPAAASAPAPEPTRSARPSATEPAAPAFDADTRRDVQEPSGGPLSVTAVRVAAQDGYDRVVFELGGRAGGQPGWQVEYVDDPRQDGSGDPVAVDGEATLAVRISGAGYPMDTGVESAERVDGKGSTRTVVDVVLGAVFEGVYEAWIGTTGEQPFRVFRLSDPARVVVDVRRD